MFGQKGFKGKPAFETLVDMPGRHAYNRQERLFKWQCRPKIGKGSRASCLISYRAQERALAGTL